MTNPQPNIQIISLKPEQWQEYKKLRTEMISADYNPFGWSVEEISILSDEQWQDIAKGHKRYATIDNQIVGMIQLWLNTKIKTRHIASIGSVYVQPQYRGRGIAKLLLEDIQNYVQSQGVEILSLTVAKDYVSAVNTYQKFRFIKVGDLPKSLKYKGIYYDEIQMQKKLNNKLKIKNYY